ncbi:MAG: hypothetical protein V1725_01185 [archaeon]
MILAEQAFHELYPEKQERRTFSLKYSRALKCYNANVKASSFLIAFKLSRAWKDISPDIQKGLLQSLLVKLFKEKKRTTEMELYDAFLKNLSDYAIVQKTDSVLEASFSRMNEKFFNGMLDKPNLLWGSESLAKLGHYEYATNTIVISTILREDQFLLDYVMYHEMLHKKLKFHSSGMKTYHHTRQFKDLEARYASGAEQRLHTFLRKKRWKRFWF